MKVGYVVKSFPRLSETFVLTEILELERRGVEVTVFSRYRPAEPVPHAGVGKLRAEVVDLEPALRERFWEPFAIERDMRPERADVLDATRDDALAHRSREEMRYWLQALPVARECQRRGLRLLHAHFATGSASLARHAARIAGVPFSFTAHAKDIYAHEVDRRRLAGLLSEAAAVVTVSDANRSYLAALAPGASIRRVYNGLDLGRFPLRAAVAPTEQPVVLFVGRFVEKKGLADLLHAVARLRAGGIALTCRLVGSGPLEAALQDLARRLGLGRALEVVGDASQEDVVDRHLAEAAVFALPCTVAPDGDRDGLPTTLLEAMACGVPVVTTTLPGVPEAVPDGEAGLLAEPGDVAGIAMAIERTLRDRDATMQRVRRARVRVERLFDARTNVARLQEIFGDLTARSTAGAGT